MSGETGRSRKARGPVAWLLLAALGAVWWSPLSAIAESGRPPLFDPAFAFFGGVTIQENSGGISSIAPLVDPELIVSNRRPNSNQPYFVNFSSPRAVGPFEGGTRSVFPHVGASVEIASPRLSFLGLVPFLHGDVALTFDVDHSAASAGDPDANPLVPILGTGTQPTLTSVSGIGSKVAGKEESWVYSAGAGVAFGFNLAGRRLWIKPSFEYRYDEVTASYLVSGAIGGERRQVRDPVTSQQVLAPTCPCITSASVGSRTKGFHSIGPGLEFEVEAARAGRLKLSLFLSGQAYRILGGRGIVASGSTVFERHNSDRTTSLWTQPDPENPGQEIVPTLDGTAQYERELWSYRANVGLRFRWQPE